ncbi:hypothetical protein [Bifidobacterium callitrichidarum]|uniref:hypothetical protein n=1 Tax=Bifidobacterium callitrichidarum TaxID=2052941 RepID=UPI001304E3D3|nr:hypothetical protein [Bifidobacterium callitrichidarum]
MQRERIAEWVGEIAGRQHTPAVQLLALIARQLLDIDARLERITDTLDPEG